MNKMQVALIIYFFMLPKDSQTRTGPQLVGWVPLLYSTNF